MITKHPTSRTLIVHPLGDLDTLRADHYRRQIRSLIDEGYRFLIFDLQDTPYINSSGLGLLIELFNKASRLEGSVKLINCSPHVHWILEQTHLNRIFVEESAEPAAASEELHYDTLYNFMSDELLLLTQIYEVTEQLMALEDASQIGELTLKGIHHALRAQRGAFFFLSKDERQLNLSSWITREEHASPPPLREAPLIPGRLEHKILEDGEVSWYEPCDQDKSEDNLFYRLGFETIITAPIRSHTRKYGLIVIEASYDTVKLIQSSRPIVRTFANICGQALEKAILTQQLRDRNEQLNAMIERAHDYRQTLIDAGQLAALGVVITGLGHLINNKMVPLMGYTQMLSQKKDLSEWVTEKVARIQDSSKEMHQIVEKLTRISRIHDRIAKPVQHMELVRITLNLLTRQIERDSILVHVALTENQPVILGNPDLILQALLAIIHRACTSFKADQTERWIKVTSQASDQGLKITVEDNGAPFDECDQDGWLDPIAPFDALSSGRIFNYTIPRSIIRKHRGALILEPSASGGKRVSIVLPAAPQPALTNPSNGTAH